MAHAVAVRIKDAAGQKREWAPQPAAPRHRLGRKLGLHRRKQRGIENGLVFTTVNGAPVDHLADIEAVLEQVRERTHAKAAPPMVPIMAATTILRCAKFIPPSVRAARTLLGAGSILCRADRMGIGEIVTGGGRKTGAMQLDDQLRARMSA